ncbi:protein-lysine N-methyltransferase EEF2KMT isoform X2 [Pieris rapae]|nr:protein-lysine N-methyltransferase EEF2KMT isoform X2 [Pieris rapae]
MYPVSSNFCRLYLKNILKCLEGRQDVHENIYDYLCTIMSNKQGIDDFYYRHYVIGRNFSQIVTLKESNNMVVNGTTGMKTWEAARLLTDWILMNKKFFYNKKILELGSGIGFTGITVTKFCDPTSVTLTDCHEDVLNAINENIVINFPLTSRRLAKEYTEYDVDGKLIRVMMLDWNDIDQIEVPDIPDIIIGADIVYDPYILEPLCKVLQSFFLRNKSISAFIACVIRNEETFNKFIQTLADYNMKEEKLYMPENINLEWDPRVNQCIVKINLNDTYSVFLINALSIAFFFGGRCYVRRIYHLSLGPPYTCPLGGANRATGGS